MDSDPLQEAVNEVTLVDIGYLCWFQSSPFLKNGPFCDSYEAEVPFPTAGMDIRHTFHPSGWALE